MAGEEPSGPPSSWDKTKGNFQTVGKGASATRAGINNGLSKLDSMSISKKGLSFKKEMSGQNVSYDRDNHVSAPKIDVSQFGPPPRRVPGQVPSPRPATVSPRPAIAASRPVPSPRPGPPAPAAPRPPATAATTTVPSARQVPPPPRSSAAAAPAEESLPAYTPVVVAPAPRPVPSMKEATTAFNSAKTMGGLYNKYNTGGKTTTTTPSTPSWSDVKAGASAAQNLHAFHGTHVAPRTAAAAPAPASEPRKAAPVAVPVIVAPKPVKAAPPPPAPKPPSRKPQHVVVKEYCLALYAFDAQAPGDLSFAVNDEIEVLERTADADAWWRGRLRGQEGIFPGNYTKLMT